MNRILKSLITASLKCQITKHVAFQTNSFQRYGKGKYIFNNLKKNKKTNFLKNDIRKFQEFSWNMFLKLLISYDKILETPHKCTVLTKQVLHFQNALYRIITMWRKSEN